MMQQRSAEQWDIVWC